MEKSNVSNLTALVLGGFKLTVKQQADASDEFIRLIDYVKRLEANADKASKEREKLIAFSQWQNRYKDYGYIEIVDIDEYLKQLTGNCV